jgi:hypothetical protein
LDLCKRLVVVVLNSVDSADRQRSQRTQRVRFEGTLMLFNGLVESAQRCE